jgi:hypothetical protein
VVLMNTRLSGPEFLAFQRPEANPGSVPPSAYHCAVSSRLLRSRTRISCRALAEDPYRRLRSAGVGPRRIAVCS